MKVVALICILFVCGNAAAQELYYYRKGDKIITLGFSGLNITNPSVPNRIKLNGVWHFFQSNDSLSIVAPNGDIITVEVVNRNGCNSTLSINLTNEESCGIYLNRSPSREP